MEFNSGNWAEAHTLFARAHALNANARTWRGLGMCSFEKRDYVLAASELEHARTDRREPLTAAMSAQVEELLKRARGFTASLTFEVSPSTSRVFLDGFAVESGSKQAESLQLNPGAHTLSAEAAGYENASITVNLDPGARRHVRLLLAPLTSAAFVQTRDHVSAGSIHYLLWVLALGTALGFAWYVSRSRPFALRSLRSMSWKWRPARERTFLSRVPAGEFASLIPGELACSREAIADFLRTKFCAADVLSPGALQLFETHSSDGAEYDYFALLVAAAAQPLDPKLGTQTFLACAAPIEEQLAALPVGRKKVVLVISTFAELGPGVRTRILDYRNRFDALVVPLYAGEIQAAQRDGELNVLFDVRVASLHPDEDLYAARNRPDPSRVVGMHREVQCVVDALRRPEAIVVVDGLPGAGKSALVARAAYDSDEPFAYLRCASIEPRNFAAAAAGILRTLDTTRSSNAVASLAEGLVAIREVVKARDSRPVMVLEDADWLLRPLEELFEDKEQTEQCQQFWAGLLSFGVRHGLRVVVIAVRGFALCQSRIGNWDNPLAQFVDRCAVPALDRDATGRLIREPGLQMNVEFEDGAVDVIFRESAGNVAVIRQLCSEAIRQRRRGWRSHRLRRISVTAAQARLAVGRQACGACPVGEHLIRGLPPLESSVLQVMASVRPAAIDDLHRAFPEVEPQIIRRSVDRLAHTGLIDGDYGVAIPFLRRWIVAYFGTPKRTPVVASNRSFVWVIAGMLATALLGVTHTALHRKPETQTLSVTRNGCDYSMLFPGRIVPSRQFAIVVTRQCAAAHQGGDALSLRAMHTTVARLDGKYARDLPITMKNGGAELTLSIDAGDSNLHMLELRDAETPVARIQVETDWVGALGDRADKLAESVVAFLVATPALLGTLATFFRDLRTLWMRIVSAFAPKRVSS